MSVYVDPLRVWGGADAPPCFRFKPSCHLYADSMGELHAMARRLQLRPEWFQNKEGLPHYDLVPSKRKLAIMYGAKETSFKHLAEFMKSARCV